MCIIIIWSACSKCSTILDVWGWCTGTTQRDGMGREEGGGFRMGNTPSAQRLVWAAKKALGKAALGALFA